MAVLEKANGMQTVGTNTCEICSCSRAMVDYWASAGPVWYLERDVQVALLWNQLHAVQFQLAQTNQQLCLQQNLILGLHQQRDADQKLISKLVGKLIEAECTESTDTGSPAGSSDSDSEESEEDWIMVHDQSEETVATEGAPPLPAEHLHYAGLPNTEESLAACSRSPTALTSMEVSAGECTPSDLHVANLLPFLGVHELLNLRLVSRRNRSPEALTAHVAEMGSMETADAVKDFARKLELFVVNPFLSNDSAFEGDAEQQKLFDCRAWCMALASKTFSHFAESCSRPTVEKNVQWLLRHCWSADTSVAAAAHLVIHNHASDALPFVQHAIAEGLFAIMEDMVNSDIGPQLDSCLRTLEKLLRSLSKPERQKWVSLMVKLLVHPNVTSKERLVWQLKMLWLVDEDPKRTYAEEHQQLFSVAVSDSGDFKNDIMSLLNSS